MDRVPGANAAKDERVTPRRPQPYLERPRRSNRSSIPSVAGRFSIVEAAENHPVRRGRASDTLDRRRASNWTPGTRSMRRGFAECVLGNRSERSANYQCARATTLDGPDPVAVFEFDRVGRSRGPHGREDEPTARCGFRNWIRGTRSVVRSSTRAPAVPEWPCAGSSLSFQFSTILRRRLADSGERARRLIPLSGRRRSGAHRGARARWRARDRGTDLSSRLVVSGG